MRLSVQVLLIIAVLATISIATILFLHSDYHANMYRNQTTTPPTKHDTDKQVDLWYYRQPIHNWNLQFLYWMPYKRIENAFKDVLRLTKSKVDIELAHKSEKEVRAENLQNQTKIEFISVDKLCISLKNCRDSVKRIFDDSMEQLDFFKWNRSFHQTKYVCITKSTYAYLTSSLRRISHGL